jgi:hypothetical protein
MALLGRISLETPVTRALMLAGEATQEASPQAAGMSRDGNPRKACRRRSPTTSLVGVLST